MATRSFPGRKGTTHQWFYRDGERFDSSDASGRRPQFPRPRASLSPTAWRIRLVTS